MQKTCPDCDGIHFVRTPEGGSVCTSCGVTVDLFGFEEDMASHDHHSFYAPYQPNVQGIKRSRISEPIKKHVVIGHACLRNVAAEYRIHSITSELAKRLFDETIECGVHIRHTTAEAFMAACMYFAFLGNKTSRTVDEVASMFRRLSADVQLAIESVRDKLSGKTEYQFMTTTISPEHLLIRQIDGADLKLSSDQCMKLKLQALDLASQRITDSIRDKRSPQSICAAIVWNAAVNLKMNESLIKKKHVADMCRVTTTTLNNTYNDIFQKV
jgi:transcription initiation factor TFIIIB Brf1 subunit/transcription initiation factor TFIIB